MRNEELELADGLYSVSDIQNYVKNIMKKYEAFTDNSLIIRTYINKIKNRITFKIKIGHYFQFLI